MLDSMMFRFESILSGVLCETIQPYTIVIVLDVFFLERRCSLDYDCSNQMNPDGSMNNMDSDFLQRNDQADWRSNRISKYDMIAELTRAHIRWSFFGAIPVLNRFEYIELSH